MRVTVERVATVLNESIQELNVCFGSFYIVRMNKCNTVQYFHNVFVKNGRQCFRKLSSKAKAFCHVIDSTCTCVHVWLFAFQTVINSSSWSKSNSTLVKLTPQKMKNKNEKF